MHSVYITIDVEDWFQVENMRPLFPLSVWDSQEWHVEANVDRLLTILDAYSAKATWFILGCVAEQFPNVVNKIRRAGQEIASHGYSHRLLYELDEDELYEDLESSKKLLEDITGEPVTGFRAPSFSINDEIVKVLNEIGYLYDSSFNDFGSHDRYGHLNLANWRQAQPGFYEHPEADFFEIPIQNMKWGNMTIPWGGGGYFRMIPGAMFRWGVKRIIKNRPYIFYMHPWEIDTKQPYIKELSMTSKFRHYTNIDKVEERFEKLLSSFNCDTVLSDLCNKVHA